MCWWLGGPIGSTLGRWNWLFLGTDRLWMTSCRYYRLDWIADFYVSNSIRMPILGLPLWLIFWGWVGTVISIWGTRYFILIIFRFLVFLGWDRCGLIVWRIPWVLWMPHDIFGPWEWYQDRVRLWLYRDDSIQLLMLPCHRNRDQPMSLYLSCATTWIWQHRQQLLQCRMSWNDQNYQSFWDWGDIHFWN